MLLRKFISGVLLLVTPLAPLYPSNNFPEKLYEKTIPKSNFREVSYTPSYDELLDFLEEIESGEMEKNSTPEELEAINYFVAFLATEGLLAKERTLLDKDIEALLDNQSSGHHFFCAASISASGAIYDFGAAKFVKKGAIRCKNWVSNGFDKCKFFFTGENKKHKPIPTYASTQ
jgi:hypothetical protein